MSAPRILRPYQQTGVDFLASRARAILGDEPGLGKSIQALRAAKRYLKDPDVLIICPAIGRVSWKTEAEAEGYIVNMLTDPAGFTLPAARHTRPVAHIVSWDTLALKANKPFRDRLRLVDFSHAVLDEAHYAKSHAANRTKAVYGPRCDLSNGVLAGIGCIWPMSGTLAPNHAGELWPHLRALFPRYLPTQFHDRVAFEEHFCTWRDTTWGRQITGTNRATLPELRAILGQIMLRRKKSDVLDDLPPMDFVDTPIEANMSAAQLAAQFDPAFELALRSVGTDDEAMEVLRTYQHQVSTMRRAVGLAKVFGAAAWAEEQLEGGTRKLILFGVHTDVLEQLRARLVDFNPVIITGQTSHADRTLAVQKFQTDPDCRVFIGNILAAGTAITLTAASTVGIVEASWVPGENYQAACRAHRIGQNSGVLCHFLHLPGTLDDRVSRVFRRKATELASLFG